MFSLQKLMNVRLIRVTTEEGVTISSMVTDANVQLALLENNVKPVSYTNGYRRPVNSVSGKSI